MVENVTADPGSLDERSRVQILSSEALAFVTELHLRCEPQRAALLAARAERREALSGGATLNFLPETAEIRDASWQAAAPREDYPDRRVEITGPTDRKLVINALNSGASGFMADFEDANAPTWHNQVSGHANLIDAVDGTITYDSSDGRHYELNDEVATLLVRPRGLHLPERHLLVKGTPVSGSLCDFGLFAFHCARRLSDSGRGVYLYLPKLEHHREARWWNDVLGWSEEALGLSKGQIRATVLIETLPAAFQMDEILYELRERSYGLNAGRWDYIFSMIKSFRERPEFVLPDRNDIKMTVPFMRSYCDLLVRTCHARGAFAMGGMAALIPSRTDAEVNEQAIAAVRADKEREAAAGFDGTWVAHPDVVPVARQAYDDVLGARAHQIDRRRDDVDVQADDLLDARSTPGAITGHGLRNDVNVAFRYISFWLGGRGAAGIENMMEDAATAEICRAQLWQWIRHSAKLDDGREVTRELVIQVLDEEMASIRAAVGEETWRAGRPDETRRVLEQVALSEDFPEFLTLPAYELLDQEPPLLLESAKSTR
ncbi:MAG: malate synthase A [Actinomycetota bacterium]|nr:malate synthase A [Actinomycetota bacterium]